MLLDWGRLIYFAIFSPEFWKLLMVSPYKSPGTTSP